VTANLGGNVINFGGHVIKFTPFEWVDDHVVLGHAEELAVDVERLLPDRVLPGRHPCTTTPFSA